MTTSRSHYLDIEAERLYTPRTPYKPAARLLRQMWEGVAITVINVTMAVNSQAEGRYRDVED